MGITGNKPSQPYKLINMSSIATERLIIKPTHKNCWSIYDRVDKQMIGKLFFRKQWFNILLKPQSLHLGVATEASFGLMKAINSPKYQAKSDIPHAQQFLLNLGFTAQGDHFTVTAENLKHVDLCKQLNEQLGIQSDSIQHPKHLTAAQLVDSDLDCFDRPTKLHPKANLAWQAMKAAAADAGVELQLVSAFRSLAYQAQLINGKLKQGQQLNQVLSTNTAPGYSEHHTGCAIDITTPKAEPLEEAFDQSPAFKWLTTHAAEFGFFMSYPKDNQQGIIYEPWHWCYHHQ